MALERLLQGKEASFYLGEISAINSVLNELLSRRGYERVSQVEDDSAVEETGQESERYPIEVDTLSAEEAAAMILAQKDYPIEVRDGQRIRFHPHTEVRVARTVSYKMDMVSIALWQSMDEMEEWRRMGSFKIPVEAFSAFVQALNNIKIDPLDGV